MIQHWYDFPLKRINVFISADRSKNDIVFESFKDYIESANLAGNAMFITEVEKGLHPNELRLFLQGLVKRNYDLLAITTYSPYALTTLNNLLTAGIIAQEKPEKAGEIATLVDKDLWLTRDAINVVEVRPNFKLIDRIEDDDLINGDCIDFVSDEISLEFEKLLEIKYEG